MIDELKRVLNTQELEQAFDRHGIPWKGCRCGDPQCAVRYTPWRVDRILMHSEFAIYDGRGHYAAAAETRDGSHVSLKTQLEEEAQGEDGDD